MKSKVYILLFVICMMLVSVLNSRADTYSTFQTTRYYSANKQYFVEVNEKKRAILYSTDEKLKRVWTRTLPHLPNDVMVANDGSRVALIDSYYGNGGKPTAKVLLMLDEKGRELSSHSLEEVVNLKRVLHTTSSSHWYSRAWFTADGQFLIVETLVRKCVRPDYIKSEVDSARANECDKAMPYEQLRFVIKTGLIVDRTPLIYGDV